MAFSNRMRGTEMFSKYVSSLYIWKHSTSKVSPRKCSFLNEMSCVQTLTKLVWGLYIWKYSRRKRNKALQTIGRVKNRWSRRTGTEVYANPLTWNFPVQKCDSNYITLKQIQIIDTHMSPNFVKPIMPRHDTFKTPGQASPNPSNFGETWKHFCSTWGEKRVFEAEKAVRQKNTHLQRKNLQPFLDSGNFTCRMELQSLDLQSWPTNKKFVESAVAYAASAGKWSKNAYAPSKLPTSNQCAGQLSYKFLLVKTLLNKSSASLHLLTHWHVTRPVLGWRAGG